MTCLNGIDIDVTAVIGSTMLPIREIVKMGRGAMIQLDCSQDDPTTLVVNDQPVARGTILVADDRMSLEITEMLSRAR